MSEKETKSATVKVDVLNQSGKVVEHMTVDAEIFGADVNTYLIHAVATAQANNARQGTKSALTRAEVRGHAKKPYRQKGTGNARQGSTKGPQFDGGGVNFAPKPRDFRTKINKKAKDAAFVSALSGKLADKELLVIKDVTLPEAKTTHVAAIVHAFEKAKAVTAGAKVLFVTGDHDDVFARSVANIPNVAATSIQLLSVLDIVTYKYVVLTVDAVKFIEGDEEEVSA